MQTFPANISPNIYRSYPSKHLPLIYTQTFSSNIYPNIYPRYLLKHLPSIYIQTFTVDIYKTFTVNIYSNIYRWYLPKHLPLISTKTFTVAIYSKIYRRYLPKHLPLISKQTFTVGIYSKIYRQYLPKNLQSISTQTFTDDIYPNICLKSRTTVCSSELSVTRFLWPCQRPVASTVNCTLYTVYWHCTLYNVIFTLYYIHCTLSHTPNQAELRTVSNVERGAQPRVQHYKCSQQGPVWGMGHWHYTTAGIFYYSY